jgi:pimeloyl-ACP methyl ester carboxylesterase
MQPVEKSRITLCGRELEVDRIRARHRDTPTLVFLHEGLGSVALWKDFPAALAERTGSGALVYSRYGNGFSAVLSEPRTPAYMHEEALRVLPALLAELEIDDPVLVGHSDGASIALIYAGEYRDALRGLVLAAPHVFVEELCVQSIASIRREYETTELRDRMAPYHTDVDRTFYGWNDVWLSPEFREWNVEECVARIRAPILAMQGLDDEYGTPAQLECIARRGRAPVDRLLIARCGHAPFRDRRAVVEAATVSWLEERSKAKG